MSDLPKLVPGPARVSLVAWYGRIGEQRGVVYDAKDFDFEFSYNEWGETTILVKLRGPVIVEDATYIREAK